MVRLLRLAIEGEQVEIVEGMFVAVPLSAQEDMLSLSTESLGQAVQGAAQAVWARIAKLIAGILAAVKGASKWLFNQIKGDRGRKINKEIVHQYEVMEETIRRFKEADPDSRMESIAKADGLDQRRSSQLSATAHALLDDPKAYLGTVAEVEKMLDEGSQSAVVKASAMLVALAKLGPTHPLNSGDAEGVQKEIATAHSV
jgi:hypothetical protein